MDEKKPPTIQEMILALYAAGVERVEIARRLGITKPAVQKAIIESTRKSQS
jgi:DNA-binding transcriptional regulator LsrR (DeoR family)